MKPCLRSPEEIMTASRIGSFHSSFLSFSRSLIRTMIHQKWRITPHSFKIDKKGIGEAVYSIQTPTVKYTAVFFTNELADELRCDRVIAESWDIAFCLCSGTITTADIKELAKNLPLQEKGRYSTDVFFISSMAGCFSLARQSTIYSKRRILLFALEIQKTSVL